MSKELQVPAKARKYQQEVIERGVRLPLESGRPIAAVARDLGVGHKVLQKRVRQAEAKGALRPDLASTEECEEIKLWCETHELRDRDGPGRFGVFRDRARCRASDVSAFIDVYRDRFGVEPTS